MSNSYGFPRNHENFIIIVYGKMRCSGTFVSSKFGNDPIELIAMCFASSMNLTPESLGKTPEKILFEALVCLILQFVISLSVHI